MSTRWVCRACGSLWAAGAPCCPACRSADHDEEGATVPRANLSGPSYEDGREPDGYVPPAGPDAGEQAPAGTGVSPEGSGASEGVSEPPPVRAPKADWVEHAAAVTDLTAEQAEGMTKADLIETVTGEGEPPSAGISSLTSESKPGKSSTTSPSVPPSPAPTTANPSSTPPPPATPPASSSTASSTAGSSPETGSGPNASEADDGQ